MVHSMDEPDHAELLAIVEAADRDFFARPKRKATDKTAQPR
jgi:hypothetical protein